MARTMVGKGSDGDQVPFLRGILTQSLVKAGLSFDDAYGLAQAVRAELKEVPEISSEALRDRVAELLAERFRVACKRLGLRQGNGNSGERIDLFTPPARRQEGDDVSETRLLIQA